MLHIPNAKLPEHAPSDWVRVLYWSNLSSRDHISNIADIAKVGRVFTSKNNISGMLLFDGERFCEYLEGQPAPMHELFTRIQADCRHHYGTLLLHGPLHQRCFKRWTMAYIDLHEEGIESIPYIAQASGEAALERFLEVSQQVESM